MNKNFLNINILSILLIFVVGCSEKKVNTEASSPIKNDHFFQYSEKTKLLSGDYEGDLSISELKTMGNFGIGTINNIDGEMVISNNNFYSIKSSGKVISLHDSVKTPFANIKFFEADTSFELSKSLTLKDIHSLLDSIIPEDKVTGVKIKGNFKKIKSRSIDAQNKPYPPLSEVIANQTIFEFEDIEGSIIGFFIPNYLNGLNFPGYHFHFIKKDLSGGGHLLACTLDSVSVELDFTNKLEFDLN